MRNVYLCLNKLYYIVLQEHILYKKLLNKCCV